MLRYDLGEARRALVVVALAVAATVAITALTAEPGATWREWISRSVPVAPLAGGFGAIVVARLQAARGELLALGTVGVSPARAQSGALFGAAILPLACAALVGTGVAEESAFFPALASSTSYRYVLPDFVDDETGRRITPEGDLVLPAPPVASTRLGQAGERGPERLTRRTVASLVVALFAVGLPLFALRSVSAGGTRRVGGPARETSRYAAGILGALFAEVVLLHAAAARHVPLVVPVLPALTLGAWALVEWLPRRTVSEAPPRSVAP